MINFAIVEDDDREAAALISALGRFETDCREKIFYDRYKEAFSFLESKTRYDVVLMDIMLPNMTGMEAAKRFRERDTETILIFTTNMMQFALQGYEVDAFDYILKPVAYERLSGKLLKALQKRKESRGDTITLSWDGGYVRVATDDVLYVEVRGHKLTYVTEKAAYPQNGTLKTVEERLKEHSFMRCNSCYLVNPEHILSVKGFSVKMRNGDELKISQPKRKSFMNEFTAYLANKEN